MGVVELEGVSKVFRTYTHGGDRIKEFLTGGRLRRHEEFWALQEVSFEIQKGETFCILGENGSGKTTLLKMIAGILQPSSGTVQVQGRVAALLELGSGFNSEFTGRENVFLNGTILGLSTHEIGKRLDDIFAFAELGEHVDQPLKTYSSGMIMRLAFSIAVQVEPEILIVDEALAVGDIRFAQRCMHKIHELRGARRDDHLRQPQYRRHQGVGGPNAVARKWAHGQAGRDERGGARLHGGACQERRCVSAR